MDYREEIIKMVEEIKNQDYLSKIYHYILPKYRRDCKSEEGEGSDIA